MRSDTAEILQVTNFILNQSKNATRPDCGVLRSIEEVYILGGKSNQIDSTTKLQLLFELTNEAREQYHCTKKMNILNEKEALLDEIRQVDEVSAQRAERLIDIIEKQTNTVHTELRLELVLTNEAREQYRCTKKMNILNEREAFLDKQRQFDEVSAQRAERVIESIEKQKGTALTELRLQLGLSMKAREWHYWTQKMNILNDIETFFDEQRQFDEVSAQQAERVIESIEKQKGTALTELRLQLGLSMKARERHYCTQKMNILNDIETFFDEQRQLDKE